MGDSTDATTRHRLAFESPQVCQWGRGAWISPSQQGEASPFIDVDLNSNVVSNDGQPPHEEHVSS